MDYLVIMAGGSGTRLWPISRNSRPKQFQKIIGDKTLLQNMFSYAKLLLPTKNIFVMAPAVFEQEIRKELPELPSANFFSEPSAKDNGPAVILASARLFAKDNEAYLGILWSDHFIKNPANFKKAFRVAFRAAKEFPDYLITIGVKPTSADTELGYIKIAKEIKEYPEGILYKVAQFKEKPNLALAKKYLSSWEYLWNTGYKIFSAKTLLSEFKRLYPQFKNIVEEIIQVVGSSKEEEVVYKNWQAFPRLSIEYLLVNKLSKILVVPADLEWSDIGNWQKLYEVLASESGHHMVVKGHHIGVDNENCLIYAEEKMIATLGLKDLVVVETADVVFIANKQRAQEVKKILAKLKEEGKYFYL